MGSSTNTPIVLSIFGFYIFVFVMMGLAGMSSGTELSSVPSPSFNILDLLGSVGFFIKGIGVTISQLPGWANTLLFAPLGIAVLYITLSYARGTS